jgi:hypothetical protein
MSQNIEESWAHLPTWVGVQLGAYTVEFIAPTKFNVCDPFGNLVGESITGTAFASQIGFTITAGATAFAAGDGFTITVAVNANAGLIVRLNLAAIDGSQNPIGVILRQTVVPAADNVPTVVVERFAVLLNDGLIYPTGVKRCATGCDRRPTRSARFDRSF